MSASGGTEDHAAVGRRIVQARRQLELTQGELAQRIGVPLGILDRYESGQADASRSLTRIAEVTGKPLDWFTSITPDAVWNQVDQTHVPTAVGQRIAESRGQRGLTRRELAEAVGVPLGKIERYESGEENPSDLVDRIASALGEPSSWLETGDSSGRDSRPDVGGGTQRDAGVAGAMNSATPETTSTQPVHPTPPLHIPHEDLPRKTLGYNPKATAELFDEVAETYKRLWEEHTSVRGEHDQLEQRLDSLQAELAQERQEHAGVAEQAARLENELGRANASRQALEALLQRSKSQLDARTEETGLPERVSELETALRLAEERATNAANRHEESERELARFREQERSLAEALVWARHTASELSEKAQREADTLVQDAERRAAELVAAGQREVERLSTERARLSEEAQREADTLVQDAQRRAAELISAGQREVERLSNERSRLESLTSEVQEDLADFLIGTLDQLKQRVGSTTVPDESVG
jgi:transcriptional regulator with XRE-family HTH domain/cell division septum initiation protein DivIVA